MLPIRFEIKPEVVEWVSQYVEDTDDALPFIEQLMGLMLFHKCIVTPDAAPRHLHPVVYGCEQVEGLVEALRNLLAYVERQADYPPGAVREPMAVKQARAALASVEQAN